MKKIFLVIFSLAVVTTVQSQVLSQKSIRIGFSGPITGELERFGVYQVKAIEDVIEKYRSNFNIEFRALDDKCFPELAHENAIKLSDAEVDFVIGHTCSGATIHALPVYFDNNVICITTSATNPAINASGRFDNFFRTIPNDEDQSKKLVDFAEINNLMNVIVVYEITDYAKTISEGIKRYNSQLNINYLGLDLRDGRFYQENNNTEDISTFINKTDIIIYCGYYPEFIHTYSFFKEQFNFNNVFLGCEGVFDEKLFAEKNPVFENVYVITSESLRNIGTMKEVVSNYINKYGEEPGPYYERTYNSVDFLLNIYLENPYLLELNNIERSIELKNILHNQEFETSLGNISFRENGDISDDTFQFFIIDNYAFKKVNN